QRDFSLVVTEALKPHRGTSLELHGQEVREETGLSKQKKGSTEVRRLARCGGAAGVVNQAVANQRTATSQHQGHTAPQAALPAPAPMPPPPQPSAIARAPPSPPEPQQAAFRLTPHAVQTPPQTQEPRGGFSPDADTPLRNERHSRQHRLPAEKMEPPASHGRLCSSALSESPQYTPPIGDYLSSRFQPALTPQPGRPDLVWQPSQALETISVYHSVTRSGGGSQEPGETLVKPICVKTVVPEIRPLEEAN
ncbi:hypothetical protein JEQ12_008245, partial [Ovis aries]